MCTTLSICFSIRPKLKDNENSVCRDDIQLPLKSFNEPNKREDKLSRYDFFDTYTSVEDL